MSHYKDKFSDIDGTIVTTGEKVKKVNYLVLKIGEKTYSTTFGVFPSGDIAISKMQLTTTKNVGDEENLWIKGKFTEEKGHRKLEVPIPFELNVYSQLPEKVEKQVLL